MLRIRFFRTGRKRQPFYKIVVTDKNKPPSSGRFIVDVGYYNPKTKECSIKKEKVLEWMEKGAQPSDVVHNLLIKKGIIIDKKISVDSSKKGKDNLEESKEKESPEKKEVPSEDTKENEVSEKEEAPSEDTKENEVSEKEEVPSEDTKEEPEEKEVSEDSKEGEKEESSEKEEEAKKPSTEEGAESAKKEEEGDK